MQSIRNKILLILALIITITCQQAGYSMGMEWEYLYKPDAKTSSGAYTIFAHEGRYYCSVNVNYNSSICIIVFDEDGNILDFYPEFSGRPFAYIHGDRVMSSVHSTVLYELPSLVQHHSEVQFFYRPPAIPAQKIISNNCLYFVGTELMSREEAFKTGASLVALDKNGQTLWRKNISGYPYVDNIILTEENIILSTISRDSGVTSVLVLSMQGELQKTMHLGAEGDRFFTHLSSGLQIDRDHILLFGHAYDRRIGHAHDRTYRLAKINIHANSMETFKLPFGQETDPHNASLSIHPNGSFILHTTYTIFLLDKDFKPYARFPSEEFPITWPGGSYAFAPNGDFIMAGTTFTPNETAWVGRFKLSSFIPWDSTIYEPVVSDEIK